MNEDKAEELMSTKCEKDYKGLHCWNKLGIFRDKVGHIYLVWQCSQCHKCVSEELEFLVYQSSN